MGIPSDKINIMLYSIRLNNKQPSSLKAHHQNVYGGHRLRGTTSSVKPDVFLEFTSAGKCRLTKICI